LDPLETPQQENTFDLSTPLTFLLLVIRAYLPYRACTCHVHAHDTYMHKECTGNAWLCNNGTTLINFNQ